MNIELKNFGPIEYLKIDLEKNLHLIYGMNAIGKSYAIYCIYCLLKNIKSRNINSQNRYFLNTGIKEIYSEAFFKNIVSNGDSGKKSEKIKDISEVVFKIIEKDFRSGLIKEFKNSLQNTFSSIGNLKNRFTNKNFQIIINLPKSVICKKITISANKNQELDVELDLSPCKIELVRKNTKTTKFSVYQDGKKVLGEPNEAELINSLTYYLFNRIQRIYEELDAGIRDIYFLPASRSGLYQALNSFAPMLAEFSQKRFFLGNRSIELPALSEPVSDYFIDLSTLNKAYVNKEYIPIVKILEENILKGEVDFDEKSKKIIYKPKGLNLELNLSEASSMVAELTPLVLFLKHILNHKFSPEPEFPFIFRRRQRKEKEFDVLFIEEPEAHLHPDVQVQLMKVFSKLTKHNLKIFVTSHSNYMFHQMNNIILDKEINNENIAVYHLVQSKNGTTRNVDMTVSSEGIDDENFQETSEKLYEERMRILEEAQ